jgi:hypothetical protein
MYVLKQQEDRRAGMLPNLLTAVTWPTPRSASGRRHVAPARGVRRTSVKLTHPQVFTIAQRRRSTRLDASNHAMQVQTSGTWVTVYTRWKA